MDKVFGKGGSCVKVEFSTSSTCNSARQPDALAIWAECVERGATATSHQVVLLPQPFCSGSCYPKQSLHMITPGRHFVHENTVYF